ncbi:MAG: DUF2470 domain-containing protein [Mycobacteriaceae bacterium]|nr:DUF2470 domain-containing protein [Mycobacteriaceae bacterium]
MPHPVNCAPTTAERIRSICARPGGALLAAQGAEPISTPVHHLLNDGSLAVLIPVHRGETRRLDGTQAMVELTDNAPLRLRAPVRSLVWIGGRLRDVPLPLAPALLDLMATEHPNPALLHCETPQSGPSSTSRAQDTRYRLLRLSITSAVIADATGAESVDAAALVAAQPDPFATLESSWLQHLDSAHGAIVARLATKLPVALRRGRVRLLGLDRYGMQFRIESDSGDRDARLAFPRPVNDVAGLSQAIRALIGCPFANGMRARRS